MKPSTYSIKLITCISLLSGCTSDAAIRAYATTAEEHATVMRLNFDRCLIDANHETRELSCNAVKSSIDAYKKSATELKSNYKTNQN